jgi:hypothetical protein
MGTSLSTWLLRAVLFAALAAGFGYSPSLLVGGAGGALAQTAGDERQAFEAAKELGTSEAWDAFLSNYPTGFHADLARAYKKKLDGGAAAAQSSPPDPAPVNAAPTNDTAADNSADMPSWCATPNNGTERAICSDSTLISLDSVLNVAYRRAKFDSPGERANIEFGQKRWIGQRNLCGGDAGCIAKRYNEQIQILESYYGN